MILWPRGEGHSRGAGMEMTEFKRQRVKFDEKWVQPCLVNIVLHISGRGGCV